MILYSSFLTSQEKEGEKKKMVSDFVLPPPDTLTHGIKGKKI